MGNLDPRAAYLMARGDAVDRVQAERDAQAYYQQAPTDIDDNERLDPRRIRAWLNQRVGAEQALRPPAGLTMDVVPTREAALI